MGRSRKLVSSSQIRCFPNHVFFRLLPICIDLNKEDTQKRNFELHFLSICPPIIKRCYKNTFKTPFSWQCVFKRRCLHECACTLILPWFYFEMISIFAFLFVCSYFETCLQQSLWGFCFEPFCVFDSDSCGHIRSPWRVSIYVLCWRLLRFYRIKPSFSRQPPFTLLRASNHWGWVCFCTLVSRIYWGCRSKHSSRILLWLISCLACRQTLPH